MNAVERALRDFLTGRPPEVAIALVGGLAVSARTEPRFTRDLDFAVSIASDGEAERRTSGPADRSPWVCANAIYRRR